jgi:hypothetical protein
MKQADIYSEIIQNFIRPLLNSKDNDEVLLQKFKLGEIIWNYCIAKEFQLPVFDELDRIVTEQNQKNTEMKAVFDEFVKYKRTDFNHYKNFIIKLEYRLKAGGKTLYVESVHPLHLKKNCR